MTHSLKADWHIFNISHTFKIFELCLTSDVLSTQQRIASMYNHPCHEFYTSHLMSITPAACQQVRSLQCTTTVRATATSEQRRGYPVHHNRASVHLYLCHGQEQRWIPPVHHNYLVLSWRFKIKKALSISKLKIINTGTSISIWNYLSLPVPTSLFAPTLDPCCSSRRLP